MAVASLVFVRLALYGAWGVIPFRECVEISASRSDVVFYCSCSSNISLLSMMGLTLTTQRSLCWL